MNDSSSTMARLSTLALFALFIVALLLALVAGVSVYSKLFSERDSSNTNRYLSGVIANSVKASDTADSVSIAQGPEGKALVLYEATQAGVYETRIYKYASDVVLEFTLAGNDYMPENATSIMESEVFDLSIDDNLVSITTDEGTTNVALRSAEEVS